MDDIEELWGTWNKTGSEDDFRKVLAAADPIIGSAITSYAPGSSPAVKSHAKVLAARAIKNYKPDQKTKFRTYLHTQLQPLQREAGSYSTVYAPERVRMDLSRLKQLQSSFFNENGREPNDDELADFTGLSKKRILHIRKFDRPLLNEGAFEETSDGGAGLPKMQQAAFLWEQYVYDELNDQDKLIYDLKTGRGGRSPMGTSDIARKLRVTAGAVSQRLAKIAERIAEGRQLEQTYGQPL